MDERAVFERIHEALELEPRPGAYERFRAAFNTLPAAAKRRPVFQLRFSRMSLRIAAAVAVVAIAIAIVAGFLTTHHGPTGSVPAADDSQVKAYQAMMRADDTAFGASTSAHCGTVSDTGCVAALERIVTTLQKWNADLAAFKTPQRFAVIDSEVRRHVGAALVEISDAEAAVGARDNHALVSAINAGGFQLYWLGRATTAITTWQQVTSSAYIGFLHTDGQALNLCAGCQALTGSDLVSCTGANIDVCIGDVTPADDMIGQVQVDVIEESPPAAFAGRDQRLQADLAAADTSLIGMLDALLAGDVATFNTERAAYRQAMVAIGTDITAITG